MPTKDNDSTINVDLANERRSISFNVRSLAAFIHGGEEILIQRKKIADYVETQSHLQVSMSFQQSAYIYRIRNRSNLCQEKSEWKMSQESVCIIGQSRTFLFV